MRPKQTSHVQRNSGDSVSGGCLGKRMKVFCRILPWLLGVLVAYNILSMPPGLWHKYTTFDFVRRMPWYEHLYNASQYVQKYPTAIIPDETVNTYAGAAYVRGTSPILIAPDTPPLGRYLIGASALYLGNEHLVSLIFFILSLSCLMYIAYRLTDRTGSLLAAALFTGEPLIRNQLIYTPLLDIIQLAFLLGAIICFAAYLGRKQDGISGELIAGQILTGMFIATKFFISGMTIVMAVLTVIIIRRQLGKLWRFVATLPLAVLVLLASYVRVVADGYGPLQLLGIQKWVYAYHASQLMHPLSVWPLIFANRWYVWFGNTPVSRDPQWNILWPLYVITAAVGLVLYLTGRTGRSRMLELLLSWSVWYGIFLSVGQTTSRYLVLYLPVLMIILVSTAKIGGTMLYQSHRRHI